MARLRIFVRTPPGVAALVLLVGLLFLVVAAPTIWGAGAANSNVAISNQGPSGAHLLGTDALGRDVLDRVLVATRSSLVLAVLATAVGGAIGVTLGALSAVTGRVGARVLGAAINVLLAFPALLLAIFFAVIFGLGSVASVFAVGASFAPGFARLTQTLAASIAERDYIRAARLLGRGRFHIAWRHMLPNVSEPLMLYGTIHVGTAILTLAGLSFLGLGVQPPAYDWGQLLQVGLSQIYLTPAQALGPAGAIVIAGIACNLAGEVLADALSGRQRVRPLRPVPAAPGSRSGGTGLLEVRDLAIELPAAGGVVRPVREVSFDLQPEERLGIVGESGSGKSMTALAIAQLVGDQGRVRADRLSFAGRDLLAEPAKDNAALLGRNMAMIFQDPGEALNPALKIGTQLREPAQVHLGLDRRAAAVRAAASLRSVAIPDVRRRMRQHQHELSGGMKQRVCIAVGLTGEPKLLIADEPTTALDVSVQRQILRLLVQAGEREQTAVLLISHDIAVVSEVCDRILVMYAGYAVEDAPVEALLRAPAHPYTEVLLAASPDMATERGTPLPTLEGRVPGPEVELSGCYFAPRCTYADERCRSERPPLAPLDATRRVACWHPCNVPAPAATRADEIAASR